MAPDAIANLPTHWYRSFFRELRDWTQFSTDVGVECSPEVYERKDIRERAS